MSTPVEQLPHWDMSVVYAGLDDPALAADLAAAFDEVDALAGRLETLAEKPDGVDAVATFDAMATQLGTLGERLRTLRAYLHSFVSTDSRNAQAQALMSQFQQRMVRYAQLDTYWTKWLGSVDAEQLVAHSELANAYGYVVRRAQIEASHQMSTAEELLASELSVSGGDAWARLYGDVSSQLVVPVEHPDGRRDMPMTLVRNLAYDARRDVRAAGYNAEMEGWQRAEVPLAAAMNGVKGEFGTLGQKRRWDSPLELALFSNNIDQATLSAMMAAAHDSFPDFRRYLRAKARLLGQEQLAWYDLFAPVGGDTPRVWQFGEARHFIVEQFASYSERLAALAQRAFEERWIDAEPRAGKRGGAFCMSLRGDESRILANYAPTIGNVMTLAHELGHAYHNATLAPQQPLNRTTPMTLAETASIFCETLVRQAALGHADADEQLEILESSLQGACQVVVDITSRFLFEQAVFEQRKQRALGAEELCALMLDAQRATYGDGLDGELLHQYAWAAKPHYYSSTRAFYNFPYMFGLLFGLGLFALYNNSPNGFHERYDALLASTGQGDAAELAARVGIDIRSQDFWRASLDTIRADVDRFEQIVASRIDTSTG